jgi:hypothetical protein
VGITVIHKGGYLYRIQVDDIIRQRTGRQEKFDVAAIGDYPLAVSPYFELQAVGRAENTGLSDGNGIALFGARYSSIRYRRHYHTHRGRVSPIDRDIPIKSVGKLG